MHECSAEGEGVQQGCQASVSQSLLLSLTNYFYCFFSAYCPATDGSSAHWCAEILLNIKRHLVWLVVSMMSEELDKLKQLSVGVHTKCVYVQFKSYRIHLCLHLGASQNSFTLCLTVWQSLKQTLDSLCSVAECAILCPVNLAFK